jgi:hypothetical protein
MKFEANIEAVILRPGDEDRRLSKVKVGGMGFEAYSRCSCK